MSSSFAGKLLVATPKLEDPNFARSVVLLLTHSADGAFGLIINRPLETVSLAELLPAWAPRVSPPAAMFVGGPVEQHAALGLGRAGENTPSPGWKPFESGLGLVDLNLDPADISGDVAESRIFLGYSGWSAGQLEREIAEDGWFVVAARPGDAFTATPDSLWRDVLRRQSGRAAMFAYFPTDRRAN